MNFKQRLRLFLIGFIPGCLILFSIINKKGCTSPNELKMLELRHQYVQLGENAKCKLKCLNIIEPIFKINMRDFKVNYDLSDIHKKPFGSYYLQSIDESKGLYEMAVEDRDTITYIHDIKLLKTSTTYCNCDTIK